jgi:PKD repeat protein
VGVSPLVATGTAAPSDPDVGGTVTFVVTPAAGAAVDRYRWDFGDGTIHTTGSNQIAHTFKAPGSHVVSVRVFPFESSEFTTVLIVVDVKP